MHPLCKYKTPLTPQVSKASFLLQAGKVVGFILYTEKNPSVGAPYSTKTLCFHIQKKRKKLII